MQNTYHLQIVMQFYKTYSNISAARVSLQYNPLNLLNQYKMLLLINTSSSCTAIDTQTLF